MRCKRACLLLLLAAMPASAQQARESIVLTVHPAVTPSPSLKYQLLPPLEDRITGNAALLYYRALSPEWMYWRRDPKVMQRTSESLEVPLAKVSRNNITWVKTLRSLEQLEEAATRSYCDWEMMPRMRKEGMGMLLPEVQGLRELATLLAVRARLEMIEGNPDRAVATLQTGMKLGRDISKGATLINGLVGVAICQIMLNQVEELMQQPGAPNLYWALTYLPHPLIDMRMGLGGERASLYGTLPALANIDREVWSAQQQKKMIRALQRLSRGGDPLVSTWPEELAGMALVIKAYPQTKEALIAGGRKPEEVEALPAVQVVLLHALKEYHRLQDDLYRWYGLPYWIARPEMERVERAIRATREQHAPAPLAADLLPPLTRILQAQVRLDRHIAILRCLEAIRLHATAHDGKLPAKLDDIHEAPLPEDPFTGKPFRYRVEGDRAILDAPAPPGESPVFKTNMLRYELTLKK